MRSKLVVVPVLLAVVACKGGDDDGSAPTAKTEQAEPRKAPVVEAAPLPADFPIPDAKSRTLVRSSSKLAMTVWEYELGGIEAAAVAVAIEDGMRAASYDVTSTSTDQGIRNIFASHDGRTYAVAARGHAGGTALTVQSFPDTGPPTLPAPTSYPAAFPFVAGGTASHGGDGGNVRIAYTSPPKDIELAMVVAARSAGWTCTGAVRVTCTREKSSVTFTAEPAQGGSLVVVSAAR